MKKTVRWTISGILFLVCFVLAFSGISEIMRNKTGGRTDMIHSFYDIKEDSLDVLALGSSHLYYSFSPNILWGEYGLASYAMGSPEQSVATSYFLLKEALQYQKPKVVLLESYYFWFDGLYRSEGRLRAAFDGIRMGEAKKEMVETFLPDAGFKYKLSYYFPFLMYHSRWEDMKPHDFSFGANAWLKGSKLDMHTRSFKNPGMYIKPKKIPQVNLEYLDKIIKLCDEKDIRLVMFASPYVLQNSKRYRRRQGINLALESYLEEKKIPFLFYQKTGEAQIDYKKDFTDPSHLNWRGQRKITECLGRYLTEEVGLTGHTGEAAYAGWEKDYAKYKKAVKQTKNVDKKEKLKRS